MPKTELDPVSNRLDAILRLLVEYLKKEKGWNAGDLVLFMESSGMRRTDIAKVMGVKPTSIPGIVAYAKNTELREKLKGAK